MDLGVSRDLEFAEMLFCIAQAIEVLSMSISRSLRTADDDEVLRVLHRSLPLLFFFFAASFAYLGHMLLVLRDGESAFPTGNLRLLARKLVRLTLSMCSLAALTRNGPLLFRVHPAKTAIFITHDLFL